MKTFNSGSILLCALLAIGLSAGLAYGDTIDIKVSQSSDDAKQNGSSMDLTTYLNLNDTSKKSGLRFQNIAIPQGATITAAVIKFVPMWSDNGSLPSVNIYGEDADDASTYTTAANNISSRTKTTAYTSWQTQNDWQEDTYHDTPDISSVVQEIVDRSGWSSGNDMAFIWENLSSDYRAVKTYDNNSSQAPRLVVEYTTGGTSNPAISGYTYIGSYGSSCYYVSDSKTSWTAADANAQAAGGHLVSLTSAAEDAAVYGMVPSPTGANYLIGLTDAASEGNWVWSDGEGVPFTNWGGGEPNGGGGENYTMYYQGDPGHWHDISDGWSEYSILELDNCGAGSTASMGDFVWGDTDEDGIQDAGESGLTNVTVTLYHSGGSSAGSTNTDSSGAYSFAGLSTGDYYAVFTLPSGYTFSPQDQGGDDALDSDANTSSGQTTTTTLTAGENDTSWDAGMFVSSGGSSSTVDVKIAQSSDDAQQNGSSMSLTGYLNLSDTSRTTGLRFQNVAIPQGATIVSAVMKFVPMWEDNNLLPSIRIYGEDVDDASTYTSAANNISSRTQTTAYTDWQTQNDWQENTYHDTPDISSVVQEIVDRSGWSSGNDMALIMENQTTIWRAIKSYDNSSSQAPRLVVEYTTGGAVSNASLGDFVWGDTDEDGIQDAGESGLTNVAVTLYHSDGSSAGSTTTDASGAYSFTGLSTGDYYAVFTLPSGYTFSPQDQGGDDALDSDANTSSGQTTTTTLTAGENDTSWDAGLFEASLFDAEPNNDCATEEEEIVLTTSPFEESGNVAADTGDVRDRFYFTVPAAGEVTVTVTSTTDLDFYLGTSCGLDNIIWKGSSSEDIQSYTFTATSNQLVHLNVYDAEWRGVNNPYTLTIEFPGGVVSNASFGDLVWGDTDEDGIQDAGESGLTNVTVTLYHSDGSSAGSTTTDASGAYSFTGLTTGDYYAVFTRPGSYAFSPQDQGGDDTVDSDANTSSGQTATTTLTAGENDTSWDAGMYVPTSAVLNVIPGSPYLSPIAEVVLDDNGTTVTQTSSQSGVIANRSTDVNLVSVTLTNGTVLDEFNLQAADVTLQEFDTYQPASGIGVVDSDGSKVELVAGNKEAFRQALEESARNMNLNQYIYYDLISPTPPVAGTPDFDIQFTAPLLPEDHFLVQERFGNSSFELVPLDSSGTPIAGANVLRFGGNGGAAYSVYDWNTGYANSSYISGQAYAFSVSLASNFFVNTGITPQAVYGFRIDNSDEADVKFFGVSDDPFTNNVGSIGDLVWLDANGDGDQDGGESGVAGVSVELRDGTGNLFGTAVTAGDGSYAFEDLPADDFTLTFIPPSGYALSPQGQGGNTALDSDPDPTTGVATVSLAQGEVNNDIDAGMYEPASLGDKVWLDADGDGIQDAGEAGVPDIRVTLYDGASAEVDTITTGASGLYTFTNLIPGTYFVGITPPAGYQVTAQNQGGDDALDSDVDPATDSMAMTTLVSAENDLTWDAGLYSPGEYCPGNILTNGSFESPTGEGDLPTGWSGTANTTLSSSVSPKPDGDQYAFTWTGGEFHQDLAVQTGYLYNLTFYSGSHVPGDQWIYLQYLDSGNSVISQSVHTITHDVDDDYLLEYNTLSLGPAPAGAAQVRVKIAANSDYAKADAMCLTKRPPPTVGDRVWVDANANGVQDGGESGKSGVTVKLYQSNGTLVDTTTTDGSGAYSFTGFEPGNYYVAFTLPGGYAFSPQDQGSDSTDSDADPSTGQTLSTVLDSGENDSTWDAGLYQPVSIGDQVWLDTSFDGIQDGGEAGVASVELTLYDASSNALDTTLTDAGGMYAFTNLVPGTYFVGITPPGGYQITPQDQANDDMDSDADPDTGFMAATSLTGGEDDMTWDAGLILAADLRNTVWDDLDADGIQDAGEPGLSNVVVTLYNVSDVVVGVATSDMSGACSFTNLPPKSYRLSVSPPAGYVVSPNDRGDNEMLDSDVDPVTLQTVEIQLAPGDNDMSWAAGMYEPLQLIRGNLIEKSEALAAFPEANLDNTNENTVAALHWVVSGGTNEQGVYTNINKEYDLIAWDSTRFQESTNNQWQLVATVQSNWFVDDDGVQSPRGHLRFYRYSFKNRWRCTNTQGEAQCKLASREIFALHNVLLSCGANFVALHGTPYTNTFRGVFGGTETFPGGPSAMPDSGATLVEFYSPGVDAPSVSQYFLSTQGQWVQVGGGEVTDVVQPAGFFNRGFSITLPNPLPESYVTATATDANLGTNLAAMVWAPILQVPTNGFSQVIETGSREGRTSISVYNLAGLRLPVSVHPSELRLLESGFVNGPRAQSDQIYTINTSTKTVRQGSTIYCDENSVWRFMATDGVVPGGFFAPNDVIVIVSKNGGIGNSWTWQYDPQDFYDLPTRRMGPAN